MALITAEVINAGTGIIQKLFKGSASRQNQVTERERGAIAEGFANYNAWKAAGEPHTQQGAINYEWMLAFNSMIRPTPGQLQSAGLITSNTAVTAGTNTTANNNTTNGGGTGGTNTKSSTMKEFFQKKWVKTAMWALGGVLVVVLAFVFIKKKKKPYRY